jgi:uncharacterized circularly permuted ATP-grasp superfamily protein/uncharacterized alpha-E superfamily protein
MSTSLGSSALPGIDYAAGPGWDALRDGHGDGAHWQGIAGHLLPLGGDEIGRRREQARRMLRDHGVTYHIHGDELGDRPWQLDALPLVIPPRAWDQLAVAVAQRARLLDAVLGDVYGPQRLLRRGQLPATAVYPHPGFLRPCHGLPAAGGRRLHLYAADLVRAPDGCWLVAADRTQAPAGAGYALENRVVLARTFPEAYREARVRRLAAFFLALRRSLTALAPRRRDNPRIVLLTPGPYNEAYFEHAYLARYLGYTLVEGGDLTVRDDAVFLKTLGGLHQVDVILRRQDDDYCDPLELRDDSALGVAGLLQAVRAGTVAVANALGSGLADSPALMPVLPGLCRSLFSEELLLPSLATWCGEEAADLLERDPAGLAVRHAHGGHGEVWIAEAMPADERAGLVARMRALPHAFVAQRLPTPATAPVWDGGGLAPQPFVLRVFAVASGDGYVVMPGGLVRIGSDPALPLAPMRRGGGSMDLWLPSEGPIEHVTLLTPASAPVEFKRGVSDLPSRVADNLYWLGRYAERVECFARLLRALALRQHDDADSPAGRERAALLRVADRVGLGEIASGKAPVALGEDLERLRRAAFAVRDRLSNDTWRIVNQLERTVVEPAAGSGAEAAAIFDRLITGLAALAGMGMENTTRGPGWRFLDLGRRLERAAFIADLLAVTIASPARPLEAALEAALEVADSAITYRSRYFDSLSAPAALDLLLTDTTNPRAMAFQLDAAVEHVRHLPGDHERALPSPAERLALGASTWLRLVDPRELCKEDENGARPALEHVLDHLASDLTLLSDAITTRYLSHTNAARNLTGRTPLPARREG